MIITAWTHLLNNQSVLMGHIHQGRDVYYQYDNFLMLHHSRRPKYVFSRWRGRCWCCHFPSCKFHSSSTNYHSKEFIIEGKSLWLLLRPGAGDVFVSGVWWVGWSAPHTRLDVGSRPDYTRGWEWHVIMSSIHFVFLNCLSLWGRISSISVLFGWFFN